MPLLPSPSRPRTRASRALGILVVAGLVLGLIHLLPGSAGEHFAMFAAITVIALCFALLAFLLRGVLQRVLWTVRNRLIATCLLMGLAPVLLFATLAGLAAYIFAGQFATNTARAAIQEALARVHTSSVIIAGPLAQAVIRAPKSTPYELPLIFRDRHLDQPGVHADIAAWDGATRLQLANARQANDVMAAPFVDAPPPPWLHSAFDGIVALHGVLYLCSANTAADGPHQVLVVATAPLNVANLSALAKGLGTISILSLRSTGGKQLSPRDSLKGSAHAAEGAAAAAVADEQPALEPDPELAPAFPAVHGGAVAPAQHFFDNRVFFSAPLQIRDWITGDQFEGLLGVVSRPTLLYARLFANSVRLGTLVRDALIVIAVLFSLLELAAFLMALRLSRTITGSIADLYGATTAIDGGHLDHRIVVERRDQLGALSTSFNTMAGSMEHLLEQQREKERLFSELEIAQEVQNNLFPHAPIDIPRFELHGVCKPARTVSGDYYDFIDAGAGQLCLALGDISGKGISAALLMASLHSAVRAFRFAGEALGSHTGLSAEGTEAAADFATPAKLLSLLNGHLYRSTPPEKYATLFLACYDASRQELTYANAGQLPPLLLRANGSVERLTCGGSVIGLLHGLSYEQATVYMGPGDLLIAYSDGVTEPENEFGDYGEERLLALVRQHSHQNLSVITAQAMHALQDWIGESEQPDDITLVLARQL